MTFDHRIIYIDLEQCPRGEALIIGHLRLSSNEVASHAISAIIIIIIIIIIKVRAMAYEY